MPPTSALASDAVPCLVSGPAPASYHSRTMRPFLITMVARVWCATASLWKASKRAGSKPWLRGVATGRSTAARSRPLAAAAINKIRLITFLQSRVGWAILEYGAIYAPAISRKCASILPAGRIREQTTELRAKMHSISLLIAKSSKEARPYRTDAGRPRQFAFRASKNRKPGSEASISNGR